MMRKRYCVAGGIALIALVCVGVIAAGAWRVMHRVNADLGDYRLLGLRAGTLGFLVFLVTSIVGCLVAFLVRKRK